MRSEIHKILVELPMSLSELAQIIGKPMQDVRSAVVSMKTEGVLGTDKKGRYTVNQSLDADTIKLRSMIAKLEACA